MNPFMIVMPRFCQCLREDTRTVHLVRYSKECRPVGGQCLTCQPIRKKPGDVRFLLTNIQSGYFDELVQYDQLKIGFSD